MRLQALASHAGMLAHCQIFALGSAHTLQESVPLNGEQPRLGACAGLELGGCSQGTQDGFLHQIIGPAGIAVQKPGIGAKIGEQIDQGAPNGFSPGHARRPPERALRLALSVTEMSTTARRKRENEMTSVHREELISALPYARRYARALTGSQQKGDALVADSLREMLADGEAAPAILSEARHQLYWGVTRRYGGEAPALASAETLSARQRQLLLLTALEDVPAALAGPILGMAPDQAGSQLAVAKERLRATAAAEVLIIEDEPIIAMDLEELVESCGHNVVGTASSEAEAIEIARRTKPTLILADINLGAGGDGTNAVAAILRTHYAPVIFVTAYPERLLTGEAVEPAFVITKPFEPLTLAIATYQAVTGGVQVGSV